MTKLMLVGWGGRRPSSARFVIVRGAVDLKRIREDTDLRWKLKSEMYGLAGAIWEVSGTYPKLIATWYRNADGNEVIRNEVKYN